MAGDDLQREAPLPGGRRKGQPAKQGRITEVQRVMVKGDVLQIFFTARTNRTRRISTVLSLRKDVDTLQRVFGESFGPDTPPLVIPIKLVGAKLRIRRTTVQLMPFDLDPV